MKKKFETSGKIYTITKLLSRDSEDSEWHEGLEGPQRGYELDDKSKVEVEDVEEVEEVEESPKEKTPDVSTPGK